MADQSFPKANRLRLKTDFARVYKAGRPFQDRYFKIFVLANDQGTPRLGLVVGKSLGKAAARNRIKRILRECFRTHKQLLGNLDLVIFPKPSALELSNKELYESFQKSLQALARSTSRGCLGDQLVI